MMRQMRDNMKAIMLVTAIAFVGLMVFGWGMDITGRSSAQAAGGELGRVNGQSITYERYLEVYRRIYDQQRQALDGRVPATMNREIEEAAWQQLVGDVLLEQEMRRRGIRVTESEIRQAARFAPPPEVLQNEVFYTDSQFDLAKYHQYLASPAVDPQLLAQLESYYRDLIPRSKLYFQVTAGSYLPDSELWRLWRDREEKVRARFISLDPLTLVADDAVSVTDREISAYYKDHAKQFERPARAQVRVVAIRKTPTAADTAAARDRALTLRQEILGGADFAEVARRESKDPGSAAQGGDLGTFGRGQMVPAFEEAVWSLPVNRVSEPVLTPFGYHLIQVQSRTADQARARHILVPIELTEQSEDELVRRADEMETLGASQPLDAVARELGLAVQTVDIVEGQAVIPGVGPAEDGVDWAFHDAEEPGAVSDVFETDDAFYMLELVETAPAGRIPLADVAPLIRARLLAEKKREAAAVIGRQLVDRIRSGNTLDQVAASRDLEVQEAGPFSRADFVPGLGQTNAAIGAAFGLQPGQTSGLVEANGRFYILQTIEKVPADRQKFDEEKAGLRARLASAFAQQRWNAFVASLHEEAEIIDNRDKVLRAPARDAGPVTDFAGW